MREANTIGEIMPRGFYARHTTDVAVDLLGKILLHQTSKGAVAGEIVEVEAYLGEEDPACHASSGKTERTKYFWDDPGTVYIFINYGIHLCINAITRTPRGVGCVLIRALEPTLGIPLMEANRRTSDHLSLTNGPAKLTQALGITMDHNGSDFTRGDLLILTNNRNEERPRIAVTARIGINKAKEEPLRFCKGGSRFATSHTKPPSLFIGTARMVKKAFHNGKLTVRISDTDSPG